MIATRRRGYGGKPKDPYIQDGLVFHLRGEDASVSEWIDAIGDRSFAMHNIVITDDGGVTFNGSNSYGEYVGSIGFNSQVGTIEVVSNHNVGDQYQWLFHSPSNTIMFAFYTGKLFNRHLGPFYQIINTGFHTVSSNDTRCYQDGTAVQKNGTSGGTAKGGNTFVGCRTANDGLWFKGTIYQIRIYNRILTEEEVLHNAAIDMNKYNIG